MCGARLYWKPSLPIEFTYAFVWLFQVTNRLIPLLWPLAVTVLSPCVVCGVWVVDCAFDWKWSWPKILGLTALAAIGYAIASSFVWAFYYPYWLWSIVVGSVLLALARLILPLTPRLRQSCDDRCSAHSGR
jgi:hypothetical protein